MANFYNNQRPSYMGQIAKKPRIASQRTMISHGGEEGKRLMSFKEFILNQNDNIDEQQALCSYSVYKTEFMKRQIDKFFKEHDDEEWLRNKYRPVEMKKIEEATNESKARRKELFSKLIEKGWVDNLILEYENSQVILNFFANVNLMLEGATMDDIEKGEAQKLYSVCAIYIRQLLPSMDKSRIEEFSRQYPGFLRVAMSAELPEHGYKRRAWITYKQMPLDSLQNIVWEFNRQKFAQDNSHTGQSNASINKDTSHHIRYTSYWFRHADAAKNDLKNVAKILTHFEGEDCPLLDTIKNYLIEETNEEETNLGINEQNSAEFEFTEDPELMKALDKILLYLRVVHSFNYYACSEHIFEDDMPQRVGSMFLRPKLPSTFGEHPKQQLLEFIEAQRGRIESFLSRPTLSEIEQVQLGKKDVTAEIEFFIHQNVDEKKEGEKYICKLTKKKFRTMDFVRKHIYYRCKDAIDEVRIKVEYFNNYLADPKRPM